MRVCLRPVVEPKHSRDDVRILGGHADGAAPAAEISLGVAVFFEFHVEGLFETAYGSRQHQGPAREFRSGLVNLQAEFLGELLNLVEIGGVGAELQQIKKVAQAL